MNLFAKNERHQLFVGLVVGVLLWYVFGCCPQNIDLKGRKVVVCGASTGIGESMAYHYAERGADIVIVARREKQLNEVAERCRERGGGNVYVVSADLSTKEGCDELVKKTLKYFDGEINTLILNHIIGYYQNWLDYDESKRYEFVDKIFRVNSYSYFDLALSFLPYLEKSHQGRIGVVSSVAGRMGVSKVAPYAASKHAINGFFDSLRLDMHGRSNVTITVHTIGNIDTPNAREGTKGHLDHMVWHPPSECAASIITTTELGERENYYPYLETKLVSVIQPIFPGFIDFVIRKIAG